MKSCKNEFKIIENSRVSHMNSDTSWIMSWRSIIAQKEENFDNLCFESSKPTVEKSRVRRTRFEKRWNEGHTFHRASGIRCLHDAGKNPASSISRSGSSGGSSNPMSTHASTKSYYRNRKSLREVRIWAAILGCQTCRKHSFETLIFKYVYFDTMMNVKKKRREQRTGMSYFQCWEQNSKINRKENSRMRIDCIVFTVKASKQSLKSVKMKMENWAIFVRSEDIQVRWFFHQDWGIKRKIPHKGTIHLHRGSSTRSILFCRSRRSYRFKEIEEGELSNSLKTWAKRGVLNSLVCNARTNFGRTESKPSLRTSLCWQNALWKLSKKIKKIVRKTTYASKGPEVTLRKIWDYKNSDVFKHASRNR